MSNDQEFATSKDFVNIQVLRGNAAASWSKNAWQAVRDACDAVLQTYPNEPLPALWWAQANGEIDGFQGLVKGVDRISAICSRWDSTDYDLYVWLREKLHQSMLSVPLTANREYTYTTALNARLDPERAMAATDALSASGHLRQTLLSGLEALASALERLERSVYSHAYEHPSYNDLVGLPNRIAAYLARSTEQAERMNWVQGSTGRAVSHEVPSPGGETRDVFLEIEGFEGESCSIQHRGWIEATSYRHTMQVPSPAIVIEKLLDASSPKLYQACCTGRNLPRVIFELCRTPERLVLRVELSDAVISSIKQETAADSGRSLEQITFHYGSVQWTYTQFGMTGLPEGVVATSSRAGPKK
jgi:type VI secretion system secreted protein Hcp